jgi:hypothetical protein
MSNGVGDGGLPPVAYRHSSPVIAAHVRHAPKIGSSPTRVYSSWDTQGIIDATLITCGCRVIRPMSLCAGDAGGHANSVGKVASRTLCAWACTGVVSMSGERALGHLALGCLL